MARIVDRRMDGRNKSAVNRKRLIRRYQAQVKKAVTEAIARRSITGTDEGEVINIPAKDISEPQIGIGRGGLSEQVLPGNKEFSRGDRIERNKSGAGGGGSEASDSGEGEDDFSFEISRDEYLDILFEELALPDLIKTKVVHQKTAKPVRAGFSNTGVPANLNLSRTMRLAKGRRLAMTLPMQRELAEKEEQLEEEESKPIPNQLLTRRLREEIAALRSRVLSIPFIDDHDLRFNQFVVNPKPSSQAVMFCLLDVSGSMTQSIKDIAKRFFILLHLFLNRSYETVELVFIRHHTTAKEVDEEEFFYSKETGGTIVSSALELCNDIIDERYDVADWNIYVAQASDGDNWGADDAVCEKILVDKLMPKLQYFAYVEIESNYPKKLWDYYENVARIHPEFAMRKINGVTDIYPVFHELFKRKDVAAMGAHA